MSNIDKRALREAAEKATKGEWWSDVVETDGEYGEGEDRVSGYHSYAVYVGHESLLDMTNSTAACIHTEWDHDYLMAWDETAKRNAEFIAAANPGTVLTLLDELETKDSRIKEQSDYFSALVAMARKSADKAMRKFPQPNYVLLKVAEEAGEVVQAGVHYAENRMTWEEVEGEIVQLLAMLIRLVTEGDQINGITPPQSVCAAAARKGE
ncbi:ead/Ea22-like family protein [Enterobacter hormaechei]|uniref:ead/Ea22-like family protein n=1 Tax=Enterobacter hormaechei TaxID=158836 RepID=UPI0022408D3D|nr:ead/Ea22-like family protein [Enterobacter hormaechei]